MSPNEKNLTVLKYELQIIYSETDIKLERSMFVKAGELKDSKFSPSAVVLPNHKILVFSTTITYEPVWERIGDFDIFDPVEGVSHELSNLCPNSSLVWALGCRSAFHVLSRAVMETLLILKTDVGTFTLNLKPPHKTKDWKYYGLSGPFPGGQNIPTHPSDTFVVIGKKICIVPYYAYDITQSVRKDQKVDPFSRWYYKFADLSVIPDEGFVYGGLTVLQDNFSMKDDIGVGFLKIGINSDKHILMRFDLYELNLQESIEQLAAIRKNKMEKGMDRELLLLPGATKVKSFELIDEADKFEFTFAFLHFAYLRGA